MIVTASHRIPKILPDPALWRTSLGDSWRNQRRRGNAVLVKSAYGAVVVFRPARFPESTSPGDTCSVRRSCAIAYTSRSNGTLSAFPLVSGSLTAKLQRTAAPGSRQMRALRL